MGTVAIAVIAQAMPKSSLKTLKSPANGSFMNPRSTMLQMNKFRAVAYIYRRVLVAMLRAHSQSQIGFREKQSIAIPGRDQDYNQTTLLG